MPAISTRQDVETWRDRTFRRLPANRVRGERSALAFVNDVGWCFTLSDFGLPVPSLYVAVCGRRHPRRPRHTHHDAEIGLTWNLKDALPTQRLCYYGKLLRGKPTLVALELFPAFCRLVRDGKGSGDYLLDYRQGRMTKPALTILDALHEHGVLETPALRRAAGLGHASFTATFDRAMAELQRGLWVVKVEEVYDPDFYYRWDLLDNWLPDPLKSSLEITREDAVAQILEKFVHAAGAAQPAFMRSLFALQAAEVDVALSRLEEEGLVVRTESLNGLPGSWMIWAGEHGTGRGPRVATRSDR